MRRATGTPYFIPLAAIFVAALLLIPATPRVHAQEGSHEIVANLAAGRVIIWVTHDAILVGAESQKSEPGSHSPLFVPLTNGHVAVLLGAVEWEEPNAGKQPVRLDRELAAIASVPGHPVKTLETNEAGDLESLGLAFLERFRPIASQIHHEIPMKPDEPIVQILVVGYQKDYGPEAWVLSYKLQQRELRDDFWDTLVSRPTYTQLYPPEKREPKTLVEFRYPAESADPTLAQLIGENDARLIPLRSADPKVGQAVQQVLDGAAQKALSEGATAFLQGALKATSAPDTKLTLAVLREGDHFDWIIPPPETLEKPSNQKRDSDAPTLRAPHHP